MNLWIDTARDSLVAAIGEIDCLLLNDAELRMLTDESNLVRAAQAAMSLGPSVVVVKRGEYGAILFTADGAFAIPGLPLEEVKDPTGAGDSFAGGFLGYLTARIENGETVTNADLRRAMVHGSMMASLNVEDFGTERIRAVSAGDLNERYDAFKHLVHFEDVVPAGTWQ
jgi:sugar/nucleoside kinase (ribokinase family)